ncbi:MAG: transposase [Myxococcales bacterium]|nr:transposase [Myxococcales bacterium]MCB9530709.1 transposase [Myxococcales bacterium]MCB9533397.1 transposase [Myxococcales bacterium]
MSRNKSLRASFINYRRGAYLVTIVAARRRPAFGTVRDATPRLSPLGTLTDGAIRRLATADVDVLAHVVMPNHVHIVVALRGAATLGTVVAGLKSRVTRLARREGLVAPRQAVWQRGFHDRWLESTRAIDRACAYVRRNPAEWQRVRRGGAGG